MGKGSKPRPYSVTSERFHSNWERTFKKTIKLENPLNQEVWYCDDFSQVTSVDGVDYIKVYKKETPKRINLMRKSALNKVAV